MAFLAIYGYSPETTFWCLGPKKDRLGIWPTGQGSAASTVARRSLLQAFLAWFHGPKGQDSTSGCHLQIWPHSQGSGWTRSGSGTELGRLLGMDLDTPFGS